MCPCVCTMSVCLYNVHLLVCLSVCLFNTTTFTRTFNLNYQHQISCQYSCQYSPSLFPDRLLLVYSAYFTGITWPIPVSPWQLSRLLWQPTRKWGPLRRVPTELVLQTGYIGGYPALVGGYRALKILLSKSHHTLFCPAPDLTKTLLKWSSFLKSSTSLR